MSDVLEGTQKKKLKVRVGAGESGFIHLVV